MYIPFRRQIDLVLRSGAPGGVKLVGCAGVAAFATLGGIVKFSRQHPDMAPGAVVSALIVSSAALVGAGIGLLLLWKDVLQAKHEEGVPVIWALRVLFLKGRLSLAIWFVLAILGTLALTIGLLTVGVGL